MVEELVAKEVAEDEFERFIEYMDIDADPADMDEEDLKGFKQQKRRLIAAIQNGSLVINDVGEPVFTPTRAEGAQPITFHEPNGAALMAMDRKKKSEDIGKLYAAMGEITKNHPRVFSNMAMPDLKICMAITTLFLG